MPKKGDKYREYTDEERENAFALYTLYGTFARTSRETGIPAPTIQTWVNKQNKADGSIIAKRNENKQKFADKAWDTINKAHELLDKQLTTALERQDALDATLDAILHEGEGISPQQLKTLITEISRMKRPDYRELTTAIGTLYDKQALVMGDSTNNTAVSGGDAPVIIKFTGDLEEWSK